MTVASRCGRVLRRRLALLAPLTVLLAVLPLAQTALGQAERTPFPGGLGTIVEHTGDGLAPTVRYNGENRFDTARLIATDDDPDFVADEGDEIEESASFLGSDTVLIARADLFPDALAGNYLAGVEGAPILLTRSDVLDGFARQALDEIGPSSVRILGGTTAVNESVADELRDEGYAVDRVGGNVRTVGSPGDSWRHVLHLLGQRHRPTRDHHLLDLQVLQRLRRHVTSPCAQVWPCMSASRS